MTTARVPNPSSDAQFEFFLAVARPCNSVSICLMMSSKTKQAKKAANGHP